MSVAGIAVARALPSVTRLAGGPRAVTTQAPCRPKYRSPHPTSPRPPPVPPLVSPPCISQVSDIALAVVVAGLAAISRTWGFMFLLKTYLIPYLVVNHWLVSQHTAPCRTFSTIPAGFVYSTGFVYRIVVSMPD